MNENFQRLWTRLIELGHHEAEIRPDEDRDASWSENNVGDGRG